MSSDMSESLDDERPKKKQRLTGQDEKPGRTRRKSGTVFPGNEKASNIDSNVAQNLPEGFFDDPKIEAKVRSVVYQDPLEIEMPKFYKELQQENNKAQELVEEELLEIQKERDLEEIEEQIEKWAKVDQLQKKVEEIKARTVSNETMDEDDDENLDLADLDGFSDWKSKGNPSVKA